MKTFAEYYKDLLERENVEYRELIAVWRKDLTAEIEQDFRQAIINAKFKDSFCSVRENSSNQSIGNQAEIYSIRELNKFLKIFTIESCSGAGYPDRILAKGDFKQIALEMKATSGWNANDSNRRVLTSSSKKLREKFIAPIYHLICTIIYRNQNSNYRIEAVRLDFIEPNTPVSVRLEASVNHKILASGNHKSIVF
ncbi:MAG: hypothetical protein ACR2N3_05830 [Pyrinomonadaceae bacterium]